MHTVRSGWVVLLHRGLYDGWWWQVTVTNLATGESYSTRARTRQGGKRKASRIIAEVES